MLKNAIQFVKKLGRPTIGCNSYQAAKLAKVASAYISSLVLSVKLSTLKLGNIELTLVVSLLVLSIVVQAPVDHEGLLAHGVLKDILLVQPPVPAPVEGGWLMDTDGGRVNNARLGLDIASLQALEDSLVVPDAPRPLEALVPIPAEAAILDDVVTDLVVRAPASDAENMERIVELFQHMYDALDRHIASEARSLAVEDRLEALVPVLAEEVVIRGPALVPMPAAELADRAYALADRIDALEVSVHSVGPRLDALEALVPTPADGVIDAVVRVPATDFDHRSRMMDRRIMNRRLFDLQALEDRGWQMVEEMRLERLADMRWQRLTDRQALEDRLLQMVLDRINGARSNQ